MRACVVVLVVLLSACVETKDERPVVPEDFAVERGASGRPHIASVEGMQGPVAMVVCEDATCRGVMANAVLVWHDALGRSWRIPSRRGVVAAAESTEAVLYGEPGCRGDAWVEAPSAQPLTVVEVGSMYFVRGPDSASTPVEVRSVRTALGACESVSGFTRRVVSVGGPLPAWGELGQPTISFEVERG